MVYAGKTQSGLAHFGVSGRLDHSNLVMWDEETESLWSQLTGRALYGERKGEAVELAPAVFVGFDTWRRIAPHTKVLALSAVPAKPWHYTTRDLARGRAAGGRALAIGLRAKDHTVAVALPHLIRAGVVEVALGKRRVLVLWVAGERAPLAYLRPEGTKFRVVGGELRAAGGRRWNALTGEAIPTKGSRPQDLRRFPYLPVYLEAWRSWYPKGTVIDR